METHLLSLVANAGASTNYRKLRFFGYYKVSTQELHPADFL
jgi:hypothetical protein